MDSSVFYRITRIKTAYYRNATRKGQVVDCANDCHQEIAVG